MCREWIAALMILIGVLLAGPVSVAKAASLNGFELENTLIDAARIYPGGPPRDGIPAIDQPRFISAEEADFLAPHHRVLGVARDGRAKAYPIAILDWHEVVNDQLGRELIVITWCPLCGSGIAYQATVKGKPLSFGVSGLLYNSDVLLYDRQTESLWSQLLSQAISGPYRGESLTPVPVQLTHWAHWRAAYPETLVLSKDTGYRRDYGRSPYGNYEKSAAIYFPVDFLSHRYHPKERVLGIVIEGQAKAYPFAELSRSGSASLLIDRLGEYRLRIEFDSNLRTGRIFDDKSGEELPAVNAYWFAWYAFYPQGEVYVAGDGANL